MDLILIIFGACLIIWGAKRRDDRGYRTGGGIALLTCGIVATAIGSTIFVITFWRACWPRMWEDDGMTYDDNIKFEMGVIMKDNAKWAAAQSLPSPTQEDLWQEPKIWRVVHSPNWPAVPFQVCHIPLNKEDLRCPVGVVYERIGRYYVNVETTHEGKALIIGKQLIQWEMEKCENK